MNEVDLRIDAYLDALARELRVDRAHARRILLEVDGHLHDAVRAGLELGLSEEIAVARALVTFGPATTVARRFNVEARAAFSPRLLLHLVLALALLGGIGLSAIGASGALSAALGGIFGKSFVASDGNGVTYTPERCAQYEGYDPSAGSCTQAALDDHFDEIVFYRLAVGIVGLLTLGGWWLARRRLRAQLRGVSLPAIFTETAGAAVFGLAALILLFEGTAGASVSGSQGGLLSGGVVAALVAGWFGFGLARTLLRPQLS
jgi:hypothetical protein